MHTWMHSKQTISSEKHNKNPYCLINHHTSNRHYSWLAKRKHYKMEQLNLLSIHTETQWSHQYNCMIGKLSIYVGSLRALGFHFFNAIPMHTHIQENRKKIHINLTINRSYTGWLSLENTFFPFNFPSGERAENLIKYKCNCI